uniref:Retrovirus-related Pol polyprotein from transposon TNT 1-94 n=1 Tax=Cajanus cajan TaxID=3821 RepID=A0A151QZK8_CAJCA|nr:Retrovirus-related Pol polyprotein from transposon TNT 1-94 [Cajanus cajan]
MIMDADTAKKAWDILEEEFEGNEQVRSIKLHYLRRESETIKMKESETIEEYYGRIKEIVNKMKLYGKEIKEKRVVEKILITLTEKYDSIVASIETSSDPSSLLVNKLIGLLGAHEERLINSQISLETKKINTLHACGICNKPRHAEKDCRHRGKPICHYCNKPGHVEKYCRNKNKHQANFAEEHNQEQRLIYANQESCDNGDGSWYLDSGCSNHMAKDRRSLLKKYNMYGCKPTCTLLVTNEKLQKVDGAPKADASRYRSLVESLLYLTAIRPDIMYATSLLSRFMQKPSQIYYGTGKRILRYLQGTREFGIWYKIMTKLRMIGYTDSDWAGSIDDMKSTLGYAFSLGSGFFSWVSKKQATIAQSTVEAEYIAAAETTSQAIWLRRILEEMSEQQDGLTVICCDNRSTITMEKNPVHHQRTKHIAIKYHFIREAAKTTKQIQLEYCSTEDQVANIFTKALPRAKFEQLQTMLGVTKICIKEEC